MGLQAIVPGGLATLVLLLGASGARAAPSTHCVKATKETKIVKGKPKKVYTGGWTNSACTAVSPTNEGKYEYLKTTSLSEPEQEELKALLKYVKVQPSGVSGKPTVQVAGANVQIVNGEGKTATTNGAGNLVIGYDENKEGKHAQTGSHDLILGEEQTFTSFGGLAGGWGETISAPFASVSGGRSGSASAENASVSGGINNVANAKYASVSGGSSSTASGEAAAVSGGQENIASAASSSVSGGGQNKASFREASVSGGFVNEASGENASVTGGYRNKATFREASISGGFENITGALYSSIFGGKQLKTTNTYEALPACVAPGKAGELC
jgi:hypothetical protein